MAEIRIPEEKELDFSKVKGNERLVRHGVRGVLKELEWTPPKHWEATIRKALADRSTMVEKLKKVLGPKAKRVVYDAEYDLDVAAREVVDIVLDAFEKQLED